MTELNHLDYYVARAASARRAADRAVSPAIAAIHGTMAELYEAIVSEMTAGRCGPANRPRRHPD